MIFNYNENFVIPVCKQIIQIENKMVKTHLTGVWTAGYLQARLRSCIEDYCKATPACAQTVTLNTGPPYFKSDALTTAFFQNWREWEVPGCVSTNVDTEPGIQAQDRWYRKEARARIKLRRQIPQYSFSVF